MPEHRGKGVAKALLAAGVKYAQDAALPLHRPLICTLVVEAFNQSAHALYVKSGFVPIRTLPFVFAPGDERELVILQYGISSSIQK